MAIPAIRILFLLQLINRASQALFRLLFYAQTPAFKNQHVQAIAVVPVRGRKWLVHRFIKPGQCQRLLRPKPR
ncbi:hypothetical protein CWC00_19700 [Pseudoalteromonas rubra]|nr:hypothetical protein CWC00_19700 [Pseudoalteromonas rubra]